MLVTVYYTLNKYTVMQFLSGSLKAYFLNSHVVYYKNPFSETFELLVPLGYFLKTAKCSLISFTCNKQFHCRF